MKKENVKFTKVWKINGKSLVVADTIEKAIELYKVNYEFPYNDIESIESVISHCGGDNSALIYEETD